MRRSVRHRARERAPAATRGQKTRRRTRFVDTARDDVGTPTLEDIGVRAAARKAADDRFAQRMAHLRVGLGVYLVLSILAWNFVTDGHGARRDGLFAFIPAAFFAFKACGLPRDARLMWAIFMLVGGSIVLGLFVLSGVLHLR
jgi:hypothetical protein